MKEIKLIKKSEKMTMIRLPKELYDKVKRIAKDNKVSVQEIVRVVLDNCIDEIKFK